MGGAAASETLIGGYICTIGGCSISQKQPREDTVNQFVLHREAPLQYKHHIHTVDTNCSTEVCSTFANYPSTETPVVEPDSALSSDNLAFFDLGPCSAVSCCADEAVEGFILTTLVF